MTNFLQKAWRAALLTVALCSSLTANAELLWSDNFNYEIGNLYGQGSWWRLAAAKTAEPVQVVDDALVFPGYQSVAAGKAVQLVGSENSSASDESVKCQFAEEPFVDGTLYYSLLVKPTELPQTNTNKFIIAGLAGKNFNGWDDGVGNTSPFNTVSISAGSEDGKFKFGFDSSTSVPQLVDVDYDLGKTYLVVVGYDFSTKVISVWVNPESATAEPTLVLTKQGTISGSNGVQGLCLYQQGNANIHGKFIVDNARVATDMASLFEEEKKPEAEGELLLSDGFSYTVGDLYNQGDWWRLAAAKTAEPVQVVDDALTYDGYQSAAVGKAVQLVGSDNSSSSDESVKKQFAEEPVLEGTLYYSLLVKPTELPQENTSKFIIAGLAGKNFNGWGDGVGNTSLFNTVSLTKGSEEGKFKFGFDTSTSAPTLVDVDYDLGETYLVVVGYDFATKAVSAWVNPASATAEPTVVLTKQGTISGSNGVQGICLYQQGNANIHGKFIVDHVRVATDMASLFKEEGGGGGGGTPELNITQQMDFTGDAAPINEDTRFATFTVDAKNLEAATSIWLGGKDRDLFTLSTEEIPAGTGSYEVVVTYHPTAIGKHSATVNFDATPTEFSSTYALAAAAYDPDNLPTITIPTAVDAFEAAPGEVDEKTVTIESENMFDYVYLAVEDADPGVFLIDQGMMLANGSYELKITFKPLHEGDYTAKVKVYSTMVDPQYIELTGHSKGEVEPEQKEGGELVLDKSNPLTYLVENFDNVEHNKPLAIDGWDNVAMEGTRAWWGYNFSTGDHGGAAKVVIYDSEAEYDTPCEMLLVTPALDFKNAASKVFTCSVMGNFLPSEGTDEVLEVLYIEDKDYMEPLQGLNIPCIADQNNEWVDYVIDFEGQPLADVFFIGFRMKSMRGHSNTKTYYVDNVSWGRTDIPQVKADTRLLEYDGETQKEFVYSPDITVKGLNLTEDIKVRVYGPDAENFVPSTATLPATGGTFNLMSYFEEEGEYVAYVELSSEGAGPFIIEVHVNASVPSGIDDINEKAATTDAYDLTGRKIVGANVKNLRRGIYIIDGKKIAK